MPKESTEDSYSKPDSVWTDSYSYQPRPISPRTPLFAPNDKVTKEWCNKNPSDPSEQGYTPLYYRWNKNTNPSQKMPTQKPGHQHSANLGNPNERRYQFERSDRTYGWGNPISVDSMRPVSVPNGLRPLFGEDNYSSVIWGPIKEEDPNTSQNMTGRKPRSSLPPILRQQRSANLRNPNERGYQFERSNHYQSTSQYGGQGYGNSALPSTYTPQYGMGAMQIPSTTVSKPSSSQPSMQESIFRSWEK